MEERIDQLLQNYHEELQLLITIPGIKKDTAAVIIAEIGVNMDQFPTSQHLASWAGVSPGNHESAGKKKVRVLLREIRALNRPCVRQLGQFQEVEIVG